MKQQDLTLSLYIGYRAYRDDRSQNSAKCLKFELYSKESK